MKHDDAFFAEYEQRKPGARRSVYRARRLAEQLELPEAPGNLLTIVGSKGKGSAAVFASAFAFAAGLRVLTVTSPAYRDNCERIRVDGVAVEPEVLQRLGERLSAEIGRMAADPGDGGYLSPGGLFLLAAMTHAREVDAAVIVAEAGRGGCSDEVSIFAPTVVAVTSIFGEHLEELGGSIGAIVEDKVGVIAAETQKVFTVKQDAQTLRLLREAVAERPGVRPAPEIVGATAMDIPDRLFPPGLNRANARLGCAAARELLRTRIRAEPSAGALESVLPTVALPGRLSMHVVPGSSTRVMIDAAVSRAGFAAAITYANHIWRGIDHILLSLPDDKDLAGAIIELAALPVTFIRVDVAHLAYRRSVPGHWRSAAMADVGPAEVAGLGSRILAMGTISFVGAMLGLVDADLRRVFGPAA
jgi:dihydrofolate synthase/folylpolyglutamate synthase